MTRLHTYTLHRPGGGRERWRDAGQARCTHSAVTVRGKMTVLLHSTVALDNFLFMYSMLTKLGNI